MSSLFAVRPCHPVNSLKVLISLPVVTCNNIVFYSGITGEDVSGKRVALFGCREVECYPWHIATKYYEADVHFLLLQRRDLVSESFSDAVEATVFHVDVTPDSFTALQTWMPFVKEFQPDVKILACDNAPEDGQVPRIQIQNWCIENGFEFVELNPVAEEMDEDVEDDFHESNSYLRIRQALHAHPWPVLRLKGPSHCTSTLTNHVHRLPTVLTI